MRYDSAITRGAPRRKWASVTEKKRYLVCLYIYYLVYYSVNCFGGYYGKYFGELGMSDGQIGLLINGTMLLGMLLQPLWGMIADRSKKKRNVLVFCCGVCAAVAFLADSVTAFVPMFFVILVINNLLIPASPVCASISIEYMHSIGREYGPLRMAGTIGYALGAALLGAVLTTSLRGMFRLTSLLLLVCAGLALLLPPVAGHQRGAQRVSPFRILRDGRVRLMLAMAALLACTMTFSFTFFTKRLGELGFDNAAVSLIVVLGVLLEIPFLFIADKLTKRISVWTWMLIGLGVTALRWLGLWKATSMAAILICQLPGVMSMICAEYLPAMYLHSRVGPELKSSAQTVMTLCCSGTARIIGGLLGGLLANQTGIANGFLISGLLMLVTVAAAFVPCRRLARAERANRDAKLDCA